MQEKHLFEYAVIRVVPCVEREEFLNAGVVLYCGPQRFLKMKHYLDEKRLGCFSGEPDTAEIEERLQAFEKICTGGRPGGPIGLLPLASRFRWLTATRSTIVQTSPVHPGLCHDAGDMLDSLYERLVIR